MARKPKSEGIEVRVDAKGVEHYRGSAPVNGAQRKGPWTTDLQTAVSWRERTLRDAAMGLLSNQRMTLGQAVDEFTEGIHSGWIRNKKEKPYRASVVRLYTRRLSAVRKEFGAKTTLDEMRLPHVARYAERLRRTGASDTEVRNTVVALRSLYVWACKQGYAVINPCVGLALPVADRRAKRIVTVPECTALTGVLVGRDRTAFALCWLAGLRAGELLALAWPEIDFDERTIKVETAIDTITRETVDEGPKTYAGRRRVPMRSQLYAILDDHAAEYGSTGLLFPADRVATDQLRSQVPMAYSSLVQRLHKRWREAGREPLNLHEGRHTYVSMLIDAGEEPRKIMEYAGHSSINVTYDVYGHLFPHSIEDSLKLMDEYDEAAE